MHFATNTVREIYPALSLADHLSFDVSEYAGLHPDIFVIEGRGTFINNNPGASLMGAVPYLMLRPVTDRIVGRILKSRAENPQPAAHYETIYPMAQDFYRRAHERGFDVKFGLAAAIMQAFVMAPISALSVVVIFYILLNLTKNVKSSVFLALLFAFATPLFTARLNSIKTRCSPVSRFSLSRCCGVREAAKNLKNHFIFLPDYAPAGRSCSITAGWSRFWL